MWRLEWIVVSLLATSCCLITDRKRRLWSWSVLIFQYTFQYTFYRLPRIDCSTSCQDMSEILWPVLYIARLAFNREFLFGELPAQKFQIKGSPASPSRSYCEVYKVWNMIIARILNSSLIVKTSAMKYNAGSDLGFCCREGWVWTELISDRPPDSVSDICQV